MGTLPLFWAAQLALLAVEEPPQPEPAARDLVLFLAPAGQPGGQEGRDGKIDVRALREAVIIYTRDLGVQVSSARDDLGGPQALTPQTVGALVRARGARLAFWCIPGFEPRSVVLMVVDAGGLLRRDTVLAGEGGGATRAGGGVADLHRAVALKLRAILSAERASPRVPTVESQPAHERAPPGPVAGAAPVRANAAPANAARANAEPVKDDARAAPAPRTGTRDPAAAAATSTLRPPLQPLMPASWRRLFVSAAYRHSLVSGGAPARQALGFQIAAGLARPVEVDAALEWAPAREQPLAAGTVLVLRDFPVRLGARLVHRGRRLLGGVGPFAAWHVVQASATGREGRQDSWTMGGGVGLEAVVRGALTESVFWEGRAWVEGQVPRTRFFVADSPAVETGGFAGGVGLGLALALPTRWSESER